MRTLAAVGASIALLAAAAPALARDPAALPHHARFTDQVIPFRSIAGVPLKATPAEIEKRFGKPDAVFHEDHKVSGFQYNNATQMQIDFDTEHPGDPAMLISADGTHLRSIKGIHFGTPVADVRSRLRGYHGLQCHKGLGCSISRGNASEPGSSVTAFSVTDGKVSGFSVSYMFNDDD